MSFLEAIPSLKSRTALTTVYAAGLRVSEVVFLKVADIDGPRMVIRVRLQTRLCSAVDLAGCCDRNRFAAGLVFENYNEVHPHSAS